MTAYMAQGSSSAGLRKTHRELDRRRKLTVVAKGGVAKKSCAPPSPPPPPPPQRRSPPIPHAAGGAAAKKPSAAPILRVPAGATVKKPSAEDTTAHAGAAAKKSPTPPPPPPPRSASGPISPATRRDSVPAARTARPPLPSSVAYESIKKGATVRVRTRVGTLPTGQCLVLWLSAVVVSAAEDGHFEVIYNGDFPRDDPFRIVRVARDHVKNMPPAE